MHPLLKPKKYDIRVIQAVRALRELRQLKQINLASDLGMTESNYCKIENGYKPVSVGQLKVIANALGVSVIMILALAEADGLVNQKLVPLSEIILQFIQSVEQEGATFSAVEAESLLSRIRSGAAPAQIIPV